MLYVIQVNESHLVLSVSDPFFCAGRWLKPCLNLKRTVLNQETDQSLVYLHALQCV